MEVDRLEKKLEKFRKKADMIELVTWFTTLGTRAQIPTGYMVKTLRAQSTCDSNMPSDQMLSTF